MFVRLSCFIIAIFFLIQTFINFAIGLIIFSELIDRIEFYINLNIITPKIHMYQQFQKRIKQS